MNIGVHLIPIFLTSFIKVSVPNMLISWMMRIERKPVMSFHKFLFRIPKDADIFLESEKCLEKQIGMQTNKEK